jgi:hypothetical protein
MDEPRLAASRIGESSRSRAAELGSPTTTIRAMPLVRRTVAGLRPVLLLAVAALALHQLRYIAGHGDRAGQALADHDHGYLDLLLPLVVSLAAVLIVSLVLAAALVPPLRATSPRSGVGRSLVYALALLTAFCSQELVEGVLSAAHPGGIDALLGDRGWVVLPAAAGLGYVVSLLLHGLETIERRVAGALAPARLRATSTFDRSYKSPDVRRLAGLALEFGFARRPPPHPALES